jgi:pyruvate,orthophosphate dikinase
MGVDKCVHFFQGGEGEGSLEIRDILGNKGARLADMASIGIAVPPGFIISAEVGKYYTGEGQYPPGLKDEVNVNLMKLERATGRKFGDPANHLLVSARSGAAVSMPGMMDTVLNIGLNRSIVDRLIKNNKAPWFVWDCYRRLLQSFGTAVEGIEDSEFDIIIGNKVSEGNLTSETQLEVANLRDIIQKFEEVFQKHGKSFPESVDEQLWRSIGRVFQSWNTPRAIEYRRMKNIAGDLPGTAVTVQAMVFGNSGDNSCSGVVFSRDISTGDRGLYGEYLTNVQGEDVVAGTRRPKEIEELREEMPEVYLALEKTLEKLEERYKDVQDVEFTVDEGRLFILQSRTAKRTPKAAIKIAIDMVEEGLITKEEALQRISTEQLEQSVATQLDSAEKKVITSGIPISPGVVSGRVVFTPKDALVWKGKGEKVILMRQETSPADVVGIKAAVGLVTSRGGTSSHAAIICRDLGKPSVVGCQGICIEYKDKQCRMPEGIVIREGDQISIDGSSGEVMFGEVSVISLDHDEDLNKLHKLAESSPAGQKIRDYLTRRNV